MFTARVARTAGISLLLLSSLILWAALPAPLEAGSAPKAKEAKLKALLRERLDTARDMAALVTKAYEAGSGSFAAVHEANLAVLHAELDLCQREKDRVVVLEKFVVALKRFEKQVVERHKAGAVPPSDVLKAKLARLEGEIALERARTKTADPTK